MDRHTEQSVSDQALRWFVRLHAGDCSDQERTVFQQWLNRSETHRTEYDRVTSLWREMDKIKSRHSLNWSRRKNTGRNGGRSLKACSSDYKSPVGSRPPWR
ncbi:MAG: FecR/PupR family sigma factor regulator [Nitrospiraceae bacterium]|nr:FecR/PupR family sigma factor regulator [Nitrospiraceae bacterium]